MKSLQNTDTIPGKVHLETEGSQIDPVKVASVSILVDSTSKNTHQENPTLTISTENEADKKSESEDYDIEEEVGDDLSGIEGSQIGITVPNTLEKSSSVMELEAIKTNLDDEDIEEEPAEVEEVQVNTSVPDTLEKSSSVMKLEAIKTNLDDEDIEEEPDKVDDIQVNTSVPDTLEKSSSVMKLEAIKTNVDDEDIEEEPNEVEEVQVNTSVPDTLEKSSSVMELEAIKTNVDDEDIEEEPDEVDDIQVNTSVPDTLEKSSSVMKLESSRISINDNEDEESEEKPDEVDDVQLSTTVPSTLEKSSSVMKLEAIKTNIDDKDIEDEPDEVEDVQVNTSASDTVEKSLSDMKLEASFSNDEIDHNEEQSDKMNKTNNLYAHATLPVADAPKSSSPIEQTKVAVQSVIVEDVGSDSESEYEIYKTTPVHKRSPIDAPSENPEVLFESLEKDTLEKSTNGDVQIKENNDINENHSDTSQHNTGGNDDVGEPCTKDNSQIALNEDCIISESPPSTKYAEIGSGEVGINEMPENYQIDEINNTFYNEIDVDIEEEPGEVEEIQVGISVPHDETKGVARRRSNESWHTSRSGSFRSIPPDLGRYVDVDLPNKVINVTSTTAAARRRSNDSFPTSRSGSFRSNISLHSDSSDYNKKLPAVSEHTEQPKELDTPSVNINKTRDDTIENVDYEESESACDSESMFEPDEYVEETAVEVTTPMPKELNVKKEENNDTPNKAKLSTMAQAQAQAQAFESTNKSRSFVGAPATVPGVFSVSHVSSLSSGSEKFKSNLSQGTIQSTVNSNSNLSDGYLSSNSLSNQSGSHASRPQTARPQTTRRDSDAAIKARAARDLLAGGGRAVVPGVSSVSNSSPTDDIPMRMPRRPLGNSAEGGLNRRRASPFGRPPTSINNYDRDSSNQTSSFNRSQRSFASATSNNSTGSVGNNSNVETYNEVQDENSPMLETQNTAQGDSSQPSTAFTVPIVQSVMDNDVPNDDPNNSYHQPISQVIDERGTQAFVAQVVDEDDVICADNIKEIDVLKEEEEYEESKSLFMKRTVIIAIVVLLTVIIITVPVSLHLFSKKLAPSEAPTYYPTFQPSLAPSLSHFKETVDFLSQIEIPKPYLLGKIGNSLSSNTDNITTTAGVSLNHSNSADHTDQDMDQDASVNTLFDITAMSLPTPQRLAVEFLSSDRYDLSSPTLIQRYALTVFYHSLNGDNWEYCSQNDRVCKDNSFSWLSPESSECDWFGIKCNSDGFITQLYLQNNDLVGSMVTEIGLLTSLEFLYLPNNKIYGTLPDSISQLINLKHIRLEVNSFESPLPTLMFSSLKDLTVLSLRTNKFAWTIPTEIGQLNKLKKLYLNQNSFSGSIPREIGNLVSLEEIRIEGNKLTGTIPNLLFEGGHLSSLKKFRAEHNQLTGTLSWAVFLGNHGGGGGHTTLEELNLTHNILTGPLTLTNDGTYFERTSDSDNNFPNATDNLNLYPWKNTTNFRGRNTQMQYAGEPSLVTIDLSHNEFFGVIPTVLGLLSSTLKHLDLGHNALEGTIPSEVGDLDLLVTLRLEGNKLIGDVPEKICKLRGPNKLSDLQIFSTDCESGKITCDCCTKCF